MTERGGMEEEDYDTLLKRTAFDTPEKTILAMLEESEGFTQHRLKVHCPSFEMAMLGTPEGVQLVVSLMVVFEMGFVRKVLSSKVVEEPKQSPPEVDFSGFISIDEHRLKNVEDGIPYLSSELEELEERQMYTFAIAIRNFSCTSTKELVFANLNRFYPEITTLEESAIVMWNMCMILVYIKAPYPGDKFVPINQTSLTTSISDHKVLDAPPQPLKGCFPVTYVNYRMIEFTHKDVYLRDGFDFNLPVVQPKVRERMEKLAGRKGSMLCGIRNGLREEELTEILSTITKISGVQPVARFLPRNCVGSTKQTVLHLRRCTISLLVSYNNPSQATKAMENTEGKFCMVLGMPVVIHSEFAPDFMLKQLSSVKHALQKDSAK